MYMCMYLFFLLLFFGFFCKLLNELVNLLPSKVDEIYMLRYVLIVFLFK